MSKSKKRQKAYAYWLIVQHHLKFLYSITVVDDLPPGAADFFNHLGRADALDNDEDAPGLNMFLADKRRREEV